MIAGMSGSLLSHDALGRLLRAPGRFGVDLGERSAAERTLPGWHAGLRARLGPATGPRAVFDCVAAPLLRILGFVVLPVSSGAEAIEGVLHTAGQPAAVLLVPSWGQPLKTMWRRGVRGGLARGAGWCVCVNGPSLCV